MSHVPPQPQILDAAWAAPERLATPVDRRAFLGILGIGGVSGAIAATLPADAARNVTSLVLNGGRLMLDQLTCHSFAPLTGSMFRINTGGAEMSEARLIKTGLLSNAAKTRGDGREGFMLWFHVPQASGLRQRVYALEHHSLGRLDLFLVPIKEENDGLVLEAIFG